MTQPSVGKTTSAGNQVQNTNKKQPDKKDKLAKALRQNLLRRKAAAKGASSSTAAESDDTSNS